MELSLKRAGTREGYRTLVTWLLPLSFLGTAFLNVVTYPFGLHAFDTARTLLTNGIVALVALLMLGEICFLWREQKDCRRVILWTACIPALFSVLYLIGLLTLPNKGSILMAALTNGCFLVSACCGFLVIGLEMCIRDRR